MQFYEFKDIEERVILIGVQTSEDEDVAASLDVLEELAEQITRDILALEPTAVMCMGEFVVCFRIVQKLKARGIKVLASCSERRATEHVKEDGTVQKETLFVFQGFREY